ncbi:hypothetical protein ABK040_004654 [Willaertia magna]
MGNKAPRFKNKSESKSKLSVSTKKLTKEPTALFERTNSLEPLTICPTTTTTTTTSSLSIVSSIHTDPINTPEHFDTPRNNNNITNTNNTTKTPTLPSTNNIKIADNLVAINDHNIGVDQNELATLIHDEIGWNLFYEFAKIECSQENVQALKDIQTLEKKMEKMNPKKKRQSIKGLKKKYFSQESSQQVNVSFRCKEKLAMITECKDNEELDDKVNEAIIQVRKELIVNLQDIFDRFCNTGEYKDWKEWRFSER